jgi:hypothetical protein
MRFLLDTNILIPLEDSQSVLPKHLANFIRLATTNGHSLLYHPASIEDIEEDRNLSRRNQTLSRLSKYQRLENPPDCPWNTPTTNKNDARDNKILYALERKAVHALVTEDRRLHTKAEQRGLKKNVYYIQPAEDWLDRLHSSKPIKLPNIQVVSLYEIDLRQAFFDSLRKNYGGSKFDQWLDKASQNGRKAWMYGEDRNNLQALCIYDIQTNEVITDEGRVLPGPALKLCTFKVGEHVRGRKIGELFLKAAFRFATENNLTHIFVTSNKEEFHLVSLLEEFGFERVGSFRGDTVYLKLHPIDIPPRNQLSIMEYHRRYFPHFIDDASVGKFIVPIKPKYHKVLFPDYSPPQGQLELSLLHGHIGNAIKLAYLCHTPTTRITEGNLVFFYRSGDLKSITSLGVVEEFHVSQDADEIAQMVSRRTVYSLDQIRQMANKSTKVFLFRIVKHFANPIPFAWMKSNGIVNGSIQSTFKMDDSKYSRLMKYAEL